jgi:uncharacterized SAM-binding protein YcdF (DUF218 family)
LATASSKWRGKLLDMTLVASPASSAAPNAARFGGRPMADASVWRRVAGRTTLAGLILLALSGAVGFGIGASRFLDQVRATPPYVALDEPADGVVALTGGPERISDAARLLASGQARRMLISGVNQATTRAALARETPGYEELIRCCADMGYLAENTFGNAVETAVWARRHGARSLIVVTSDYHMPRALAELGQALPDARLIAYPIRSASLEPSGWWRDFDAVWRVSFEYAKFLRTKLRNHIQPRRAELIARATPA